MLSTITKKSTMLRCSLTPLANLHLQALPNSRDGHAPLLQLRLAVAGRHALKGPEVGDAEGLEVGESAGVVRADLVDAVGVVG